LGIHALIFEHLHIRPSTAVADAYLRRRPALITVNAGLGKAASILQGKLKTSELTFGITDF